MLSRGNGELGRNTNIRNNERKRSFIRFFSWFFRKICTCQKSEVLSKTLSHNLLMSEITPESNNDKKMETNSEGVIISQSAMRLIIEEFDKRIQREKVEKKKIKVMVGEPDGYEMTPEAFQEVIREKKLDVNIEAEERRLDDLKRIVDMKSRTGISPLALFPKDIWSNILHNLDPGDRANMRQLHPVFLEMIEPDVIRDTLFPLVLDYKLPLVERYLAERYSDPQTKRRDLELLINLRLVSKCVRDSADKWIADRLVHFMRNTYERDEPLSSRGLQRVQFDLLNSLHLNLGTDFEGLSGMTGSLTRFLTRSLRVHFSPFIQRWFRLSEEARRQYERSLDDHISVLKGNITGFLEEVGDQIWHVDLNFGSMEYPQAKTFYDVVRQWLLLMPNLMWLELKESEYLDTIDLDDDHPAWRRPRRNDPMPTLCELERLDFDGDDVRIVDVLLTANPHVKYFTQEFIQSCTPIEVYRRPKVLSLPLETANVGDHYEVFQRTPTCLQHISLNNWNLRRITLWLGQNELTPSTQSMSDVIGFIQGFHSLEEVELHIDHVRIEEDIKFLRLPNLKNFTVTFGSHVETSGEIGSFISLLFLLHCTKLKELVWEDLESSVMSRDPMTSMIGFAGGREDLRASNIWEVFPRLRSVKAKFVEYVDEVRRKNVTRLYRERQLVSEEVHAWEVVREISVTHSYSDISLLD